MRAGLAGRRAVAVAAMLAVTMSAAGCAAPGEVRVRSLVLVDADGVTRGVLRAEDRARLTLHARERGASVGCSVVPEGYSAGLGIGGMSGASGVSLGSLTPDGRIGLALGERRWPHEDQVVLYWAPVVGWVFRVEGRDVTGMRPDLPRAAPPTDPKANE